MTARRDYAAAFAAALLLHAGLLALLGRSLSGGGLAAPSLPARPAGGPAAPPLTVSLRPASAPVLSPVPSLSPAPRRKPAPSIADAAPAVPAAAVPAAFAPVAAAEGPALPSAAPPREVWAPGRPGPGAERVLPRLAGALEPVFPLSSRRRGEEGDVRLKVFLTAAGRVREVRLLASSGFVALDRSALRAARRASFVPAFAAGRPVDGELVIRVRFRLEES